MEVKPGYKQTEVGVIPDDWDVKLLPDVCRFRSGKAHEQYISETGRYVCVNSKFISTDGKMRKYSTANFCRAKKDDVLMVMSDLPNGRALAKAYLVEANDLYAVNQRVCALTAYRDCPEYLFYVLNRNPYFLKFDDGVNQTHLLNHVFQKCTLPIPREVAEQRAIAEALSDVDALVGDLDRVIEKKRDLKQAAMQQLLTGQTRLPGFHGEWQQSGLKTEAKLITKGATPTSYGRGFVDHGINFFKAESFAEDGSLLENMVAYIDESTHSFMRRSQLAEGDILFSIAGALGRTTIVRRDWLPANTNQALALVRLKKNSNLDGEYLARFLASSHVQSRIAAISVQAAQPNLSLSDVGNLAIKHPELEEQQAIAGVLTDMDSELSALQKRRDKIREVKQAMKQELLSGKTRIV
jgi:type I restriction enzyme S subunit